MSRKRLYPSEEVIRITVRIPETLKDTVEKLAVLNHRSLTQEMVTLIEEGIQSREKQLPLKDEQPSLSNSLSLLGLIG